MGFPKIVVTQNVVKIMENPIKMDDLGVSLFPETSISNYCKFHQISTQKPSRNPASYQDLSRGLWPITTHAIEGHGALLTLKWLEATATFNPCDKGWNMSHPDWFLKFHGLWNSSYLYNWVHSLKLTSHLKIGHLKRKLIFLPSIFKCYVSWGEGSIIHYILQIIKVLLAAHFYNLKGENWTDSNCRIKWFFLNLLYHPFVSVRGEENGNKRLVFRGRCFFVFELLKFEFPTWRKRGV